MIRPFTCVCMILAGGSGLYLYQSKHRAQMLDREIGRVLKQTEVARERIGVLRAEWAVLNEPDRLAELSQQHLGLRQLNPQQFTAVTDLGARLPAPVAPGTAVPPPEEPVVAQAAPPAPQPRPPAVTAAPAPAPAPRVAAATPAPAPASRPAAPARIAPDRPAEHQLRAPAQLAAPAPVRPAPAPAAPVMAAAPAPMPARPLPPMMNVAAAPIPATPRMSVPAPVTASVIGDGVMRASALGGARASLPPPTPYGSP